jgi:hypothetical protein
MHAACATTGSRVPPEQPAPRETSSVSWGQDKRSPPSSTDTANAGRAGGLAQ